MTQANVDAWERTKRLFAEHVPSIPATKVFHAPHDDDLHPRELRKPRTLDIEVLRMDTLEAASSIVQDNPLVLIFADAHSPGGCVVAGAGMQEESLFRRTALHKHLLREMYPIEDDACIYAPDVPVLGCRAPTMSFVACPGIKMPWLKDDGRFRDEDVLRLRKKVELICQVAIRNGHSNLVLGPLGCGVWGCPPRHVAEIFRETLLQKYSAELDKVVFAMLGANLRFFHEAFSPPTSNPTIV